MDKTRSYYNPITDNSIPETLEDIEFRRKRVLERCRLKNQHIEAKHWDIIQKVLWKYSKNIPT